MRLSDNFEPVIFLTKKPWTHKNVNQTKTNWQNKTKQTKNNKGNKFSRAQELLRGWKSVFLHFGAFLRSRFRKKKLAWNCLDNLILLCYVRVPLSTHLSSFFICDHLRESFFMRTLFHPWECLLFYENSFSSLRIFFYENSFLFMRIYVFMKISKRMNLII